MTIFVLVLLMLFTCCSTRCCPVHWFLSDGMTRDVSSVRPMPIVERTDSPMLAAVARPTSPDYPSSALTQYRSGSFLHFCGKPHLGNAHWRKTNHRSPFNNTPVSYLRFIATAHEVNETQHTHKSIKRSERSTLPFTSLVQCTENLSRDLNFLN